MTTDNLAKGLTAGALRLLATQKSDGGWQWMNPTTDPSQGLPTPDNTLGVTAQGLLDCYRDVPLYRLLVAGVSTYDRMVLNSQDPTPAKHRIRGPDITFLVDLCELRNGDAYALFAKNRWAAAIAEFGGGSAAGFAAYIRDARKGQSLPAVISWDINLYIQGVLALNKCFPNNGYIDQAKAMAEIIYNSLYTPRPEPTIDGVISAGEWGSPAWTITGSRANYNVYFVAGAEALYVAFEYLGGDPTITPPTVFTSLYIDGNNNSIIDGSDKALLFQNRNGLGGVVNWLRMYLPKPDGSGWDVPPNYDNPGEFGYRWSTPISPDSVPVKIGISADRKIVEWRIPRALVGAVGESIGLKWQAFDSYNWNNQTPALNPPPPDFDITVETQAEYWLGVAGALEAFLTTGIHPQEVSALRTKLTAGQQSDGHFVGVNGGSDVQTTAYALMVLIKAGDDRPSISAMNYLVSSQKANGGWLYDGGENTEVTSEAIQAIHDFFKTL